MAIAGDVAGKRMRVVVAVPVEAEAPRRVGAEQAHIFGMPGYRARLALAANVPVEADHAVARAEHHMQIVGDEKDAAAARVADRCDEFVKLRGACEIHGLGRSSRTRNCGSRARARASSTRWNSPPDSSHICASMRAAAPVSARQAVARSFETCSLRDMKRFTESGMMRSMGKRCGT